MPVTKPSRKVSAGALGAAVATLIVGVAAWLGAPQPPVGLEGAIATVASLATGYFVRD